jgi:hypothetical protein
MSATSAAMRPLMALNLVYTGLVSTRPSRTPPPASRAACAQSAFVYGPQLHKGNRRNVVNLAGDAVNLAGDAVNLAGHVVNVAGANLHWV